LRILSALGGFRYEYKYDYSDVELQRVLAKCRARTYVLFNNTSMHKDALRFRELLTS